MDASPVVRLGFPLIAAGVLALFLYAVRAVRPRAMFATTLGCATWVGLCGGLAYVGVLSRFDLRPPPMALMFVVVLGGGVALGLSRLGGAIALGVPLWALVGAQAFRLPLELLMHRAADEGVMPDVMSFSGYNFDILTGATALLLSVALARGEAPRWLVLAWNVMGSLLLATIAVIAFLASPMVLAFGPEQENVWVTWFPYVYLPTVMVLAAVTGHVVIFRRLATTQRGAG